MVLDVAAAEVGRVYTLIARVIEVCKECVTPVADRDDLGPVRFGREVGGSGEASHEGVAVRIGRNLHARFLSRAAEEGRIRKNGVNDQRTGHVISRDLETDLETARELVTASDLLLHAVL